MVLKGVLVFTHFSSNFNSKYLTKGRSINHEIISGHLVSEYQM